jgi:WD40 repeat protein/serine/threonine protein kinase
MPAAAPSISDYQLLRQIGRGAYGEVWLGRSVTGIYRAIKIVYRDRFEESRPYEREFAGIKRFEPISRSQENLVDVLHVGRHDERGFFYYVMELADPVSGEPAPVSEEGEAAWKESYRPKTLRAVLARGKRLPSEEYLPIAVGLARAIKHLHEHGLIHRDIKPSNVIFVNGSPKLADIGLISGVEESRSFVGTEGFVPPEGPGTAAADVFSFGKVLYEMSTGRDRLDFPKLPDDLEEIPKRDALLEFNEVVLNACQAEAKERYPGAAELLDDLLLLQAGRSVKRLRLAERRLARLVPLAVMGAVVGLVALFIQYFKKQEAEQLAKSEARFRRQAEAQELATRQLLYAADMNLAHQAYIAGDLGRVQSLLAGHVPKTNTPDLRGFEWRYYETLSRGEQQYTFPQEKYPVAELAFSADGKTLAAAAYDYRAELWDVESHKLLREFSTTRNVENIGLSPDGKQIGISDASGSAQVRNVSDGRVIFERKGEFRRLAMNPARSQLALGGGGKQSTGEDLPGTVEVWDYRENRLIYSLPEAGTYVAFSPDGSRLATGSSKGKLKLWDLSNGHLAMQLGPVERNFGMSFSPGGKRIAVGDQLGFLHVWNTETGEHISEIHAHSGEIFKTAFSPDGKILASVSADQTVRLSDAETLSEIKVLRGHTSEVWGLAFSPDGETLATCGKDGTIRFWRVHQATQNEVFTRDVNFWAWPVFSPDGQWIATSDKKRGVSVWHVADGMLACLLSAERPIAFGTNSETLLTLGAQGELQNWNCATTNLIGKNVTLNVSNIRAHAFLRERELLVTGDRQGDVRLWNVSSGKEAGHWKAHPDRITSLALSADHTMLATASEAEDEARVWDLSSHQLKLTLRGHKMYIFFVAFSPDGRTIATASVDDTCGLWDSTKGKQLALLGGHKGGTYSVAFSPDQKTIVVGGGEGGLKLWNVATRRDMLTLPAEPHAIFWSGFSPDGLTLAAVSFNHHTHDCSLKVWRADANSAE